MKPPSLILSLVCLPALAFAEAQLVVLPEAAELVGRKAQQAFVVQLVHDDGRTEDVTGEAKLRFDPPGRVRADGHRLRPEGDGQTTLVATHGKRRATSRITVKRAAAKRDLSFRLDVMPVFMRAGCNTGACHGSARGQDGFHLSLFGYDPAGDYHRLTRELVGRRLDLAVPERSLILEKAIGAVTHTGGEVISADSESFDTLRDWIAAGASDDAEETPEAMSIEMLPSQLVFRAGEGSDLHRTLVRATYNDGSVRDITHLSVFLTNNEGTATIDEHGSVPAGASGSAWVFARFDKFTVGSEVIVLPNDEDYVWPDPPARNYIDEIVFAKLEKLQIAPSDLCTDEEFLRRAFLDLVGLPPTVEEYTAFMEDEAPGKRDRLIDRLLEREEFSDLWAMKWGEILQVAVGREQGNSSRSPKAVYNYSRWVRKQVGDNRPLDAMVRDLVSGSGSNLSRPQANYYTSGDRIDAKKRAENFAQQFLGMRIQCTQCHNHPFDRWTMDDYYGFTSFFEGVTYKNGADPREFFVSFNVNSQSSEHPVGKRPMQPKFLGGDLAGTEGKDPRGALAGWLTGSPWFAENLANRTWAHFFGRGIVEPVDDVRISNPPSNRELYQALASKLTGHGFDHRRLVRDICRSRTYQLSSRTHGSNYLDETQFSHAAVRRLQSEILADSLSVVTDTPPQYNGGAPGMRATQLYQGGARDPFLKTFGTSSRTSVCDCEVSKEATLSQALALINGSVIDRKLRSSPIVNGLLREKMPPAEIIDHLYVRVLSRRPTDAERNRMLELIGDDTDRRQAYDDVFWSLLNSTEFSFNH